MDKFRDIVCVLCIECAGMILRHIVYDECRHLLGVVHACAIVEGVWSPHGGQDWRGAGTIGSLEPGAMSPHNGLPRERTGRQKEADSKTAAPHRFPLSTYARRAT